MDTVASMFRGRAARAALLAALAVLAALAAVEAAGAGRGWWFSWARELSVALLVLLSAWSAGRFALGIVLGEDSEGRRGVVVETAAGLSILCGATMALGTLGGVRPVLLALLLAAGLVPAARGWLARRRGAVDPAPDLPSPARCRQPAASSWPSWPGNIAVAAVLALGFLYASLPPVFYDTLVYHLGLPNLYLATGSLTYWSGSYLSSYPQNAEMLGVLAMALGGEKAAQLLGFGIACLIVVAVRRLARREAGAAGADLAFLFLASQWPFWFGACFGKNDLTGALFLVAALAVALEPSPSRPLRSLAVAGALAGFGVGVKLTNALPALLIACVPLLERGVLTRERARRSAVFLLAVLVTASPWPVRNAVYRGNPFFPAFYSLLGGRDFSQAAAERMERDSLMDMDRSPGAAAARVAGIGFDRERYASGGELSPLTIPLLLLGLALSRRRETAAPLGIALLTLAGGVGFLSAVVRVYAIAWVLVPLAAAVAYARFRAWPWRAAVVLAVAAAAVPGLAFSTRMLEAVSAGGHRVFLGRLDPADYLAGRVNYLEVADYANARLPDDSRILAVGTSRTVYIRRRCDAPSAWDDAWIARASRPGADPTALRDELRDMGYTHVLLNAQELQESEPARRAAGILGDPAAPGRLDAFFRTLRPLFGANGCTLFEIPGS